MSIINIGGIKMEKFHMNNKYNEFGQWQTNTKCATIEEFALRHPQEYERLINQGYELVIGPPIEKDNINYGLYITNWDKDFPAPENDHPSIKR
jgi:hypothetical protein